MIVVIIADQVETRLFAVARIQGILLEINIVENKSELYCQNQSFGTGLGSISHY